MFSMAASSSQTPLPMITLAPMIAIKLDSTNYIYWRTQMLPLLSYQQVLSHVDGTETAPPPLITNNDKQVTNPEYTLWLHAEQQTIILLNASLTAEALSVTVGLSSAREIWNALEAAFCNTSVERVQNLRDHLRSLKKGNKTVAEFGRSFKAICDQLNAVGHPIDSMDQLHWFLYGLGPSFESFSTNMRTTRPIPTFSDLIANAESHELFMKHLHGSDNVSQDKISTMENNDLELGDTGQIQNRVKDVIERLNQHKDNNANQFSPSIYMVPHTLRDLSKSNAFNPREVSIGPLHREDEKVQAFEGQKETYVIKLMNRIRSPQEEILNSCMQKVYKFMEQIKACYGYAQMMTPDDEFAERMVIDACFVIEFVLQISESLDESRRGNMLTQQTIIYDLVLLENQIPFFILDEIYQCTVLKFNQNARSLVEFIHPLLNLLNIFKDNIKIKNISISNDDHILSLLHKFYEPQDTITSSFLTSTKHSALDLENAGVNFKPNRNPTWLMAMEVKLPTFQCFSWCCDKPTLRMPVLYVHDFTELVLRNLIAYEHRSSQTRKHITSYAYAMDMLVNTQQDVAKLVESRVLVNDMGSNEKAAEMINNICKEVAHVHLFYGENLEKLNKYCSGYWPEKMARLKTNYFSSPWSAIALGAGVIVFLLTGVQTVYTILAYMK